MEEVSPAWSMSQDFNMYVTLEKHTSVEPVVGPLVVTETSLRLSHLILVMRKP